MHISLDNISFYSPRSPTKPASRALPASCWRAYNVSVAPQPLPRALPPRPYFQEATFSSTSGASTDVSLESRDTVAENLDSRAGSEFDIEIERAVTQSIQETHETDLDLHLDSGLRNECRTDVSESDHTYLITDHPDRCPLGESLGDLDTALIPAEPQLHHAEPPIASTVAPADLLRWRRDSISSLGIYDEADKSPGPPEVNLTCPRVLPSPPTDVPARPSIETIIQDESVVDDTTSGLENYGDQTGITRNGVTTQIVQVNEPSISEAVSDKEVRGRLTESQTRDFPRLGPQTRSINRSQATLANSPSLCPRRKAKSEQRERFPAVSVVIPVRRNDKVVASAKKNSLTRIRRCSRSSDSDNDSDNLEKDRVTRMSMNNYSPSSGGPNSKARGRPLKTSKRAKGNVLAPSNDIVGKYPNQSRTPSGGSLAVSLDKTQEIFGRGVLRIQTHGPRQAYFMTFLPEVSHHPSMPSPSEMPPEQSSQQSSRFEDFSRTHPRDRWDAENAISEIYLQPVRMETGGRPSCHDTRHLVMAATKPSESAGGACGGLQKRWIF
ncbi:hypothetical protein N7499_003708 [Penicillium canescens]|uniref:Uncharacterized protein n=1 Tax=Penicillium canescens TaxID=5083 RepID=A0AAD6N7V2_PENCN|nr:uncharacterized protein N7446_012663 [Penicillium canescens]KAJ6018392.1 hypothetical protein N7522_001856 [Penicillium canescens]KAJ6038851.1 hypothetical protein N7460_007568 [Penicillium canescens]KAJ6045799.1 hypothetical protein N7446_012663 [Penicillium canescens]KAJ6066383.1 hypothetical protein N7444_000136 [Penicillium canescens]KAJ6090994.1 hypothetical protein N7499_003708 [Penicillium canescens]